MSLLVEHGLWPQDGHQMHPFFHPVRQIRPHSLQSTEPQASSLGDVDRKEDGPDQNSSRTSSQAPDSSPSTSVNLPQAHHSDDLNIDPNQDRRKRRKVTTSSEAASTYHATSVADCPPTEPERHAMGDDREAVSAGDMVDLARNKVKGKAAAQLRSGPDELSSKSSEQISPPSTRQLTINLSPAKPKQSPSGPEPDQKTTPKKTMLQLSARGRLSKSPKRNPLGKGSLKTDVASSKNLSLKNGRIVSSLKIIVPYSKVTHEGESSIGTMINQILRGEHRVAQSSKALLPLQQSNNVDQKSGKATHPFFLGKATLPRRDPDLRTLDERSTGQNSDIETAIESKKPTAWGDIKFSSTKYTALKDINTLPAPWPPLEAHYRGQQATDIVVPSCQEVGIRQSKHKTDVIRVSVAEDILHQFGNELSLLSAQDQHFALPKCRFMLPDDLLKALPGGQVGTLASTKDPLALQSIKRRLHISRSAFDCGKAAGPLDWAHEYAPKIAEDVLQPQSRDLVEWLRKMKVHQVQSKLADTSHDRPRKVARRRGRPKRKEDDMDDFLASSGDESVARTSSVKNAIIICGPNGCGKTASVYAAAAELDFEVFEIHPGMRRGAKDIFDRVGDMTHNHLVQQSASLSRDSSTLMDESDTFMEENDIATGKQQVMTGFIHGAKKRKEQQDTASDAIQPDRSTSQKQSVILLEEVDILFEDDRSFWPGVQALIEQSKRPIILTCNSLESIPLEDLALHTTLSYERPPVKDVAKYLSHVAASEGHLLDPDALSLLYRSRGQDLRASLMDLHYWCQMTVGSKIGGLDWINPTDYSSNGSAQPVPRVISCGTFYPGLNLVPERLLSSKDLLTFCQDQLAISALEWEAVREYAPRHGAAVPALAQLDDALAISDARSCMDILDASVVPIVSTAVSNALPYSAFAITRAAMFQFTASVSHQRKDLKRKDLVLALDPIMEDLRTFPPPIGRTAPNIDGAGCSVATEIAPYVRSIVSFDQRLEQQRSELGAGSKSGKQRTTRAARAALEGGDKSSTRRERWFPKDLDYEVVLSTGMGWPQWQDGEEDPSVESRSPPES